MPSNKSSIERLENWTGVITGADPDVIPDDASPLGANAIITHVGATAGAVRRRKGALSDGYVENEPVILGLFDYYSAELGKVLIIVDDDGGLSAVRVDYTITWDPLLTFAQGTPISVADHLNATTDILGTFSYSLPEGTVLDVGSWPLQMTFTPTDLSNYTVKRETVTLVVTAP